VCGRSLKRHLTLNGKGRIEGLQPEVIDCGYFNLPELQVKGCPKCKGKKRDLVCPNCTNKVHMHFAMFPEELVMPALRMSCPDQVCSKCGVPRFPIYTPTEEYAKLLGQGWHEHEDDAIAGQMQEKVLPPSIADYRISAWTDCGCGAPFQPAICLDPFAGFNTVGAVAMKHGRNFVGIDLDQRNVKAGNRRIVELTTLKRKSKRAPITSLHLQNRLIWTSHNGIQSTRTSQAKGPDVRWSGICREATGMVLWKVQQAIPGLQVPKAAQDKETFLLTNCSNCGESITLHS
jgi:hypothetical protein